MWRIDFKMIQGKDKAIQAHQDFHDEDMAKEAYKELSTNQYLTNVQKPYKIATKRKEVI